MHAAEVNKDGKAGKVELTVRDKGAHVFGFCACKHAAGAGIPTYELHGAVVTGSDHPATDSGAGKGVPCVARAILVAQGARGERERHRKGREAKTKPDSHAERHIRERSETRLQEQPLEGAARPACMDPDAVRRRARRTAEEVVEDRILNTQ